MDRTHDSKAFRMLTVSDEFTRRRLAIQVKRRRRHNDVLAYLTELFTWHGPPDHIRSDNYGAEFTAIAVWAWLPKAGVKTLFIVNRVYLGRTATTRPSTASSETSCSTEKSSTP